jgi:hypothetical protein
MKKIILLLLLVTQLANAQETKFELTAEKFTDYVVIPFEGKTQAEIYKKTLQWIEFNYSNPKEVIKASIENEYIRFQGLKEGLFSIQVKKQIMPFPIRYTIEVSFKDGKAKFDVITTESYHSMQNVYVDLKLEEPARFFTVDKYKTIYNGLEIPIHYNSLVDSLSEFVKSDSIPSKKSDW